MCIAISRYYGTLKIRIAGWGSSSVVKCLPSSCKALGSAPSRKVCKKTQTRCGAHLWSQDLGVWGRRIKQVGSQPELHSETLFEKWKKRKRKKEENTVILFTHSSASCVFFPTEHVLVVFFFLNQYMVNYKCTLFFSSYEELHFMDNTWGNLLH